VAGCSDADRAGCCTIEYNIDCLFVDAHGGTAGDAGMEKQRQQDTAEEDEGANFCAEIKGHVV